MTSKSSSNNCNGGTGSAGGQQAQTTNGSKQDTPFNIELFEVLLIFCIIIALTSSLYYNWPAVERILIDDKVFQNLCTKDEILNAIDGMFVCDKQRIEIGDLALVIFYSEFVAFAIGGILTDIVGVHVVLIIGFMFGFTSFTVLYYFYMDNFMVKLSFAFWGMFGGLVFITSIQFPKMFPKSKSLSDGMIIMFDNLSGLMTLIVYKIMKMFGLKYYEAFATYIIWGIFPAFVFTVLYMPTKIGLKTNVKSFDFSKILEQYKCLGGSLSKHQLWLNLVVFSIPVTCSIFYKKTFSTYFLKNQTLVRLFPIIMLFVFVPTIFIAALNQFMGVHITSTILYIFYIISFVCFLYPTKQYGLLSIILFVISTSAAEQQTMTYISEQHPQNESTLLGISYAVDFLVGSILQRLFTCIFNRKPKAILFVVVPLFLICIGYSIYCHIETCNNGQSTSGQSTTTQSKSVSYKALFVMLWFIPFLILCIRLVLGSLSIKAEWKDPTKDQGYQNQKVVTNSVVFYTFSFYYVCNIFHVVVTIFRTCRWMHHSRNKIFFFVLFLSCFFIVSQLFILIDFSVKTRAMNLSVFVVILFVLKIILYIFTKFYFTNTVILLFSIFLVAYGKIFFQFIYMLAYYNFQITYVERTYKNSVFHWNMILLFFMVFRIFYKELSNYNVTYCILTSFLVIFFGFYSTILYNYFPYEMDKKFEFKYHTLPVPSFAEFSKGFCQFETGCRLANVALSICNLGIMITLTFDKKMIPIIAFVISIHSLGMVYLLCPKFIQDIEWAGYVELGFCVVSIILFLTSSYVSILKTYNEYMSSRFFRFILFANFCIFPISNAFSWLNVQRELQKCCCTDKESSCGCKGNCCCVNGKKPKECECCKRIDGKCCCCCGNNKKCTCKPPSNGKCTCVKDKCQDCVCKCPKKVKKNGNSNHTFCFYDCNFKKVDESFLWFYLGTIGGWLLFIFHLGTSKDTEVFNLFK